MAEKEQNVVLNNRNSISVSGIEAVESFDNFRICAVTFDDSLIVIEGEGLTVSNVNLENGTFYASGLICGIYYDENKRESTGVLRRFFNKK